MRSNKKTGSLLTVLKTAAITQALVLGVFFNSANAQLNPLVPLKNLDKGQSLFGMAGSYLLTTNNYDIDGSKLALPGSDKFSALKNTLFGSYGLAERFTLFADLQYAYMAAESGSISLSTGGLGDVDLGGRFVPKFDLPFKLWFEAGVQLPAYSRLSPTDWSTMTATSNLPLGEGLLQYFLSAAGEYSLAEKVFFNASLGVNMRGQGFSNIAPYSAYIKYREPRGLMAHLGLVGQFTVTEDQYTNQTPNDRSTRVIARSFAMNTINPTFTKIDLSIGNYLTKSFFAMAGAQTELMGKNTSQGILGMITLGFDLPGEPSSEEKTEYTKSNRGFQEYSDVTAHVVQVNSGQTLFLVDKGRNAGIKPGDTFDVFEATDGSGEALCRAQVQQVGPTRTKLQVIETFKEGYEIKEGAAIKRPSN